MSSIIAFAPEVVTTAPRRLRALSRGLVVLFTLLLGVMALSLLTATIICLFFPQYAVVTSGTAGIFIGPHGAPPLMKPGMIRLSDQPLITRLASIADIALALVPFFFVFWHLRALFGLYAAGIVFARENATHLRSVGLALIAYPFVKFTANMIFRTAGGTDHVWFGPAILLAPLTGLIIVAIAQVMEFGRDIELEKDLLHLMPIIVRLDVMLAKRQVRSNVLARAIGITDSNLSLLKSGKVRGFRFSTLEAICKYLDCQPGDILEYFPDEKRAPLRKTG